MINRLLIGSIFTVYFFAGFIDTVCADEPIVTTTEEASCWLFGVTNEVSERNLAVTNNGQTLSSYANDGGVPVKLQVNCNSPATIQVSSPVRTGGTGTTNFNQLSAKVITTGLAEVIEINSGQSNVPLPVDNDEFVNGEMEVNMQASTNGSTITPGTYDFSVTITVTP